MGRRIFRLNGADRCSGISTQARGTARPAPDRVDVFLTPRFSELFGVSGDLVLVDRVHNASFDGESEHILADAEELRGPGQIEPGLDPF